MNAIQAHWRGRTVIAIAHRIRSKTQMTKTDPQSAIEAFMQTDALQEASILATGKNIRSIYIAGHMIIAKLLLCLEY